MREKVERFEAVAQVPYPPTLRDGVSPADTGPEGTTEDATCGAPLSGFLCVWDCFGVRGSKQEPERIEEWRAETEIRERSPSRGWGSPVDTLPPRPRPPLRRKRVSWEG